MKNDIDSYPFPNIGNSPFYSNEFSVGAMLPQIPINGNIIRKEDCIRDNTTMKNNISKVYGAFDQLYNRWNAAIDIDGNTYRYRVECLIVKKNSVFLTYHKNEFRIPGGSGEKDIPDIQQVANECREEARINIQNVIDTGIVRINKYHKSSFSMLPFKYYGAYSKIYIADYGSTYNGNIEEVDKDKKMMKGKFYPINFVINKIHPEWKKALLKYYIHEDM